MKDRKHIITIILLIILIIIILYFIKFGTVTDTKVLVPTGNVDVFDIGINCNCKDKEKEITYTDKKGNPIPVYKEELLEVDEDYEGEVNGNVYVDDNTGDYVYLQKLEIFKNAAFQNTEKIAPGSSNVYQFVVHNSTDAKIKYSLNMIETTNYNINMKYRLKKNNEYITGWVRADKLVFDSNKLEASESDNYSLEWKWEFEGNDPIDTLAGKSLDSEYKLTIKVDFRAIV